MVLPVHAGLMNSRSPDNTVMYFTDSTRYTIWQYDFDTASGNISNRRVFTTIDHFEHQQKAEPDGLAVDAEGCVWSALWAASKVVRFSPQGKLIGEVHLPALRVSCPTFGGKDMDELFITTAALDDDDLEGRRKYVENGSVFRIKVGVKGLPKYRFKPSKPFAS
jgi:sugar lactone lactonase YvrE